MNAIRGIPSLYIGNLGIAMPVNASLRVKAYHQNGDNFAELTAQKIKELQKAMKMPSLF